MHVEMVSHDMTSQAHGHVGKEIEQKGGGGRGRNALILLQMYPPATRQHLQFQVVRGTMIVFMFSAGVRGGGVGEGGGCAPDGQVKANP